MTNKKQKFLTDFYHNNSKIKQNKKKKKKNSFCFILNTSNISIFMLWYMSIENIAIERLKSIENVSGFRFTIKPNLSCI